VPIGASLIGSSDDSIQKNVEKVVSGSFDHSNTMMEAEENNDINTTAEP